MEVDATSVGIMTGDRKREKERKKEISVHRPIREQFETKRTMFWNYGDIILR